MTNRRIFFGVVGLSVVLVILVIGNIFFSVKKIIPSSIIVSQNAARINQLDEAIAKSNSLKIGQSIFTVNEEKVARSLEKEFYDIQVLNVEKTMPSIVYVDYKLLEEEIEISNGSTYFQASTTGRVLNTSSYSKVDRDGQKLIKMKYAKLDSSIVKQGYDINLQNFDYVSSLIEYMTDGSNDFFTTFFTDNVENIDLNSIDTEVDAKFVLNLKGTATPGRFEIYTNNKISTISDLILEHIGEVIEGKSYSIKGNGATLI